MVDVDGALPSFSEAEDEPPVREIELAAYVDIDPRSLHRVKRCRAELGLRVVLSATPFRAQGRCAIQPRIWPLYTPLPTTTLPSSEMPVASVSVQPLRFAVLK